MLAYMLTYLIQPGDTLSGIAASHGVSLAAVEAANPEITNPDLIYAGNTLRLSGGGEAGAVSVPSVRSSPYVPRHSYAPRNYTSPSHVYTGGSSFRSCVIQRESGGNAQAVNTSSGAGGLYQFLPSTWASLGYSGSPQDASVAEQNAAFDKLYAEAGTSPWSAYDGC